MAMANQSLNSTLLCLLAFVTFIHSRVAVVGQDLQCRPSCIAPLLPILPAPPPPLLPIFPPPPPSLPPPLLPIFPPPPPSLPPPLPPIFPPTLPFPPPPLQPFCPPPPSPLLPCHICHKLPPPLPPSCFYCNTPENVYPDDDEEYLGSGAGRSHGGLRWAAAAAGGLLMLMVTF